MSDAGATSDTVFSALTAALRDDLASAGFSVQGLSALWGDEAGAALFRGHRVAAIRALDALDGLGSGSALTTLARAFVLGFAVSEGALATALPRLGIEGAMQLGLVASGESIQPLLELRPYAFVDSRGAGQFVLVSDLGELALGHAIPEQHVLGVGGASMTLSSIMIAEPVENVLDLGTGCGIQALHAARHAKRVVATDISQRALHLADFNARLNGIANIEFRLGSLFEPVAGEHFDQIVSNPPFVITPRAEGVPSYEYRDGGMVGDALVASVVRGVARMLTPGGTVQLLANWEYREGDDGLARVSGWIDDAAADGFVLDAWVVEREVLSTEQYAETWIRDGGTRPGVEFDQLTSAWLDDFAQRGVSKVGFGYVMLRRPVSGEAHLRRLERLDGSIEAGRQSLGRHIAASFAAADWLESVGDEGVADARLTVATDVTEERHYWPGDEHPTVMTLRQGGGFGRTFPVGTAVAAVVGACDGELSIRSIVAAVAELLEVDGGALEAELLPELRELVFTGFLTPLN